MPYTLGFASAAHCQRHFLDHGRDFGAQSVIEYLEMADRFLGVAADAGIFECQRKDGCILRYGKITGEFGILSRDRVIKTYFIPCEPYLKGRSPLDYFREECKK